MYFKKYVKYSDGILLGEDVPPTQKVEVKVGSPGHVDLVSWNLNDYTYGCDGTEFEIVRVCADCKYN